MQTFNNVAFRAAKAFSPYMNRTIWTLMFILAVGVLFNITWMCVVGVVFFPFIAAVTVLEIVMQVKESKNAKKEVSEPNEPNLEAELTALVYPGYHGTNAIAPLYVYTGGEKDAYLVVEVDDSVGTSTVNAAEGVYAAIVELRGGDTNFRLFDCHTGFDSPRRMDTFSEVTFSGEPHDVHLGVSISFDAEGSPRSVTEPNALSVKVGSPGWLFMEREDLLKTVGTLPEPSMVKFKDYFPDNEDLHELRSAIAKGNSAEWDEWIAQNNLS